MRKVFVWLVIFIFSTFFLYSNDAYTRVSGGSVLPLSKTKHESIKMEKEEINFTLYKDYYDINVKFYFKNYGPTETIEVGFPQWKHLQPTNDDFYSFSSKVNGKSNDFAVKNLKTPEPLNDYMVITKWYVRSITFESNEITTTEVQYSVPYGVYGISSSADYLYGTGATWKDCIGEMVITITNKTDDIWINGIQLENLEASDIQRNQDSITITKTNVYPKLESEIFLQLDSVPDCLVSLRVINPERRWYFRDYIISENSLLYYSDSQLRILRNLMFAAYGNIFKSEDINTWLQKYCSEWYKPTQKVYDDTFNENEKKNLELIMQEEARRKNNNYLDKYFSNETYKIKTLNFENRIFKFAYLENKENSSLITKGLIYTADNNDIKPYLFIDDYIIRDNSKQITYPIKSQSFYGWKIEYDNKSYLSFQIFTDAGKHTTDSVILYFDKNLNNFVRRTIDPSQY